MKQNIISFCCLTLFMALLFSSCIKQDEYQKFLAGGEISYAGRADTVIVRTGNERVVLFVALGNDPLVNKVKVYWNNGNDSLISEVQRSGGGVKDTVEIELQPLAEGSYNFELYTFNTEGSRSVVIGSYGFVYGPDYVATLKNRELKDIEVQDDGSLKLVWPSPFVGETGLEFTYNDKNGQPQINRLPLEENEVILTDFESESELKYRSLFKPDTLSLDEFSTAPETIILPEK